MGQWTEDQKRDYRQERKEWYENRKRSDPDYLKKVHARQKELRIRDGYTVKETKVCSMCKTEYLNPIESFARHASRVDGLQTVCKSCKVTLHRNRRHGLEFGEIERMTKAQQNCCAICNRGECELVLDHDHRTGVIRAMLCRHCNALLGMCDDSLNTLRKAVAYLERFA